MTCQTIRERIHDAFDENREHALPEDVRSHIASCDACRELAEDLGVLRSALRGLPREPLPPAALDAVWRQTVRADRAARWTTPGWRRAAAAAVFVTGLAAATLYLVSRSSLPPGPSAAELARAEAQAELVFGYTARALAATRDAAAHHVIEDKVSPAVRGAAASRPSRRS